MVCISCGNPTQVVNSRHRKRSNQIWRRRKCLKCDNIYTSEESIDYFQTWRVANENNELSPFQRDKLLVSIYNSCKHRPEALNEASELCFTVIQSLTPKNSIIDYTDIIDSSLSVLQRFDQPAYVYYKAYHPVQPK